MRHLALAVALSLGLVACAGNAANNGEAKSADDANVWANFKGTYSEPAEPRAKADKVAAPSKKESAPKSDDAEASSKAKAAPAETTDGDEKAAMLFTAPKKPASKGTVKGESVSSLSVDALAASVGAAKLGKVSSSGVVTGKTYEVVTVESKKATIKIIRPAVSPNAKGPQVSSPSEKLGDIAKNESAWFDEEGDVIVVVSAPKKATAAKVLNSIVKH